MTGSPITSDLARTPQGLAPDTALRRDFSRIDPLDRSALVAVTGPPFAPTGPTAIADRLAGLLDRPAVATFASGDAAMRQTLSSLLTEGDDVIVDAGSEKAMFETVRRVDARLHASPPGSVEAVERRLSRLSRSFRRGRIFVLVPAVSRLSSVVADLEELGRLCAMHGAVLVVDVTQDLGTMGVRGLGVAEVQGCPAQIDVLLGDLSVTSGVAGGFAAFRDPALASRLIRTGAMQPHSDDSAAMILAVLDLIASAEGRRRRRRLQATSLRLRNHLMGDRLPVMGQPSPVVPLRLPKEMAKAMASMAALAGLRLPLVGPPDVPGCAPRWLIRLSAGHGPADIDDLAATLHDVIRACARQTLVSAP